GARGAESAPLSPWGRGVGGEGASSTPVADSHTRVHPSARVSTSRELSGLKRTVASRPAGSCMVCISRPVPASRSHRHRHEAYTGDVTAQRRSVLTWTDHV